MASTSIAGKQHFPEESRFKEMFTCNLQEIQRLQKCVYGPTDGSTY